MIWSSTNEELRRAELTGGGRRRWWRPQNRQGRRWFGHWHGRAARGGLGDGFRTLELERRRHREKLAAWVVVDFLRAGRTWRRGGSSGAVPCGG
jgi:hypothetical protein